MWFSPRAWLFQPLLRARLRGYRRSCRIVRPRSLQMHAGRAAALDVSQPKTGSMVTLLPVWVAWSGTGEANLVTQ